MSDVAEGWGKYRLLGTIGTGATGTVYLCEDVGLGRQVAVKELAPALISEPGFLPRFRQEAQLMARLQSPNCVQVFDFFEQDGRPFLVMEYVPGATLRAVLGSAGRLSPEQALGVLRSGISGLGFAHAAGVVHRDLKPENVLVDAQGVSKLSDFGQALVATPDEAGGATAQGTPAYMSPEQVRGGPVDYRADIYSAGVVLFELLTGSLPFAAAHPAAVMRMHLEAPVPDPRSVNPSLPEPVAQLVTRAMAKDPAGRQPGALDFFHGLEAAAVAGYGQDWASRSSIRRLAGPAVAAAAAALAAGGTGAAAAGTSGAAATTGAAVVNPGAAAAGGTGTGAGTTGPAGAGAGTAGAAGAAAIAGAGVIAAGAPAAAAAGGQGSAIAASQPVAQTSGGQVPPTAPPPGRPVRIRPLRALVGTALGALMILGGTGFGATHGVLPVALAPAGFGVFGKPPANPASSGAAAGPARAVPSTGLAAASAGATTTVFVLDISGSMDSPAVIPAGFPKAAELKERQDEFEGLVEQARGHQKVPVGTLVSGISGLVQLVQLQVQLQDYLTKQGADAKSLAKITALKLATGYMIETLTAEHSREGTNNQVGIVTFSSEAAVLAPVTPDPASVKAKVAALEPEASTNIGDGLQQAVGMLEGQPAPAIILLTDGWNNSGMSNDQVLSGPVAGAAGKNIPVCTIGLGSSPFDVDQELLQAISSRTGGGYYFVPDRVSLAGDMEACHHSAAGQLLTDQRGKLAAAGSVSSRPFNIPAGKRHLTVTVAAPGSTFGMEVADGSGRVIADAAATATGSPGLAVATVSNPPPGAVTVRLLGQQVDANSPDYFLSASTDGQTTDRHVTPLAAGGGAGGSLARQRVQIRQVLTAAAIIAGICFVALSLRGLARRLRQRRTGRTGGGWVLPLVLYPGAVLGVIALIGAGVMNLLWDVPLVPLPSF
jgi:uncharacterized protein YegL